MTETETAAADGLARSRVLQVFNFLAAFAERREPSICRVAEHAWVQRLAELPAHPFISVGQVRLADGADDGAEAEGIEPLLRVRRPSATAAPEPPAAIRDWLKGGWKEPFADEPEVIAARNETLNDSTSTVRFEEDAERVAAFASWRASWDAWAEAERPVRRAIGCFERFFSLRARLEREGERLELLMATGRLLWQAPELGGVDHPVLLQRVELTFDATKAEICIVDADRAPELYLPVLAVGSGGLSPKDASTLREELNTRGYHPLEKEGTGAFLGRLATMLHAKGRYSDHWASVSVSEVPHVAHDPMLLLRNRSGGFAEAIRRVIDDIEHEGEIPVGLSRLVGVDRLAVDPLAELPAYSPWAEPPDILLSKPANSEQIQIAQALERYKAVLVQGPPGTGKSHTIANLIGHLVAQGKRVLITSHTTKALAVLRDKVEGELQPLCLSVLDSDSESRKQLEDAVRTILSRLTQSNVAQLSEEVGQLSRQRERLLAALQQCTTDLQTIRQGEYQPIVVGGSATSPAEGARWITEHANAASWVPAPVENGAPLPLSVEELRWIYESNGVVSGVEEAELSRGLPDPDALPTLSGFEEMARCLFVDPQAAVERWFAAPLSEDAHDSVLACAQLLKGFSDELAAQLPWQRALVAAGHTDDPTSGLWQQLAGFIDDACALWRASVVELNEHEPSVSRSATETIDDQLTVARQLLSHVQQGGSLHKFALLLKPTWRRFLDAAQVQDRAPLSVEEFQAIIKHLELELSRDKLVRSWRKIGESIGLPAIDTIAHPREQKLEVYAIQIRRALTWWESEFQRLFESLETIGFQWSAFRTHHAGRLAPATPFDHDVVIAGEFLPVMVNERLLRIRQLRAQRQLAELRDALARYTGPVVETVRDAVDRADPIRYKLALASLNDLIVRSGTVSRRRTLLERLGAVAPTWAAAIRDRIGVHGATVLPGEPTDAWRWVQFDQELRRRAALDEVSLMAKLHELQQELRRTTVKLIDRKAWLGQMQRVTLQAQQALQGWAQLQRKIGRGTGKRVPELQAAARRLLAEARDAVPVWIMPLTRVAENIDLSRDRFDVVIVDEASQSDVLGLLAWYLGHSIVVVGDDQQVSPLAVGQSVDAVTALRLQYLTALPNNETYDAQTSVYDLAGQCFGGTIALREHFRCVPEIIAFSNHLSYEGSIRPLRDPSRVPRPHVVEVVADDSLGGFRRGSAKVNHSEARLIAALLKACLEHPRYAGATFGAITLLGDEQAKLLQDLALDLVGAVALDRCRFAAGNSAQFQGDERNVIFLSMVDGPRGEVHRISNLPATRQRYNVAASRAQDQLWLVHSLDPTRDLHAGDLRRRLIEHVRDPNAMQREFEKREALTESPFEKAVLRDLLASGYDVQPQVWVGRYRLDFVIRCGEKQVAFECDGDRYHGFEKIADDLARQAILERAGWRFVRVRGSQYFRDPRWTMQQAFERLSQLGIEPSASQRGVERDNGADPLTLTLLQRAWEIMREQAWVVSSTNPEATEGILPPQGVAPRLED